MSAHIKFLKNSYLSFEIAVTKIVNDKLFKAIKCS